MASILQFISSLQSKINNISLELVIPALDIKFYLTYRKEILFLQTFGVMQQNMWCRLEDVCLTKGIFKGLECLSGATGVGSRPVPLLHKLRGSVKTALDSYL